MLSKGTVNTILKVLMTTQCVVADMVTVHLTDPANLVTSTNNNDGPLPTGKSLALHKADNGDVNLNIGDGLASDLGTALDQNCKDKGPQCEAAVEKVLLSGQYELQSRNIGLVLAAGGIVLAIFVSEVIEMWNREYKKVPTHFIAPAAQVSSAIANPSATNVVIETGNGGAALDVAVTRFPNSVSAINTATLTSGVFLTQATVAADGHAKGDYLFDIKDQGALTWLQNNAKDSGTCQKSRKMKRQDGFGCATGAAMNAMGALNGPLASLLLIGPTQLPSTHVFSDGEYCIVALFGPFWADLFADVLSADFVINAGFANGGDLARAVRAIFDSGRAIAALVPISGRQPQYQRIHGYAANIRMDDTLWMLAELFLYLYDEALNHGHPWVENDFIAGSVFEQNPSPTSTNGPCPTGDDEYICQDKDCKGVNNGPSCTVSGPKSSCSCASLFTPFANLVDDGWLDSQQKILASMVSYGKSANAPKPTLNCANDGPAHLNRDWALGQVSTFCNSNMNKRVLPKTPAISQNYVEGTQENFVAGTGQNTTLSIGWAPGDACNKKGDGRAYSIDVDECNKQLSNTIDECDTKGPTDGKHGGQVTEGCIIFANSPQTNPPSSSATPNFESYCTSDSDCKSERCPIGPSTCEPFGAPGVNPQGLK